MGFLQRIFIGLIIVGLGYLLVWKTRFFVETFGESGTVNNFLGSSGTYLLVKAIGIFGMFVGFIVIVGLQDNFLGWLTGPLINNASF